MSEVEIRTAYERHAVIDPARPVFRAVLANPRIEAPEKQPPIRCTASTPGRRG